MLKYIKVSLPCKSSINTSCKPSISKLLKNLVISLSIITLWQSKIDNNSFALNKINNKHLNIMLLIELDEISNFFLLRLFVHRPIFDGASPVCLFCILLL